MVRINWLKTILISLLVLLLFAADRLLKSFFGELSGGGEFFVWGDLPAPTGWLRLRGVRNQGIAFSWPVNHYLLLVLHVLIIFFLVSLLLGFWQKRRYVMIFWASLILAGAMSNLLDRFYFGGVIDYFDLKSFSVFNLADIMITLGAVGLILDNLKRKSSL